MSFRYPFPNSGFRSSDLVAWMCVLVVVGCTARASDTERKGPPPSSPITRLEPATSPAPEPEPQPEPQAEPEPESAEVEAKQHVSTRNDAAASGMLELAGDLRPDQAADLSFKIGGMLAIVKVKRGERVKRGQVLAGLSDLEARAQYAAAEAAVIQATAQLELARDTEVRTRSLVDSKAMPGSQATQVRLQTAIAQAAVLQSNGSRDLAAATLQNHTLRAAFDGEITKVPDGLGQTVQPGTPLFRIESLDTLVLRATLGEGDVDRVRVGDEVTIESQGQKFKGKVRLVLRSLEAVSRRAPIEIEVANDKRALIAGSYVRATIRAR